MGNCLSRAEVFITRNVERYVFELNLNFLLDFEALKKISNLKFQLLVLKPNEKFKSKEKNLNLNK